MGLWTRRGFAGALLGTLPVGILPAFEIVRFAWASEAWAGSARKPAARWALQLQELCRDLEKQLLSPTEWQAHVETLFTDIGLTEVLASIDFERVIAGLQYPDDRAATRRVDLPGIDTQGVRVQWGPKIFALRRGRAIVPHAHNNMVSSHLVLRGSFHVRTFQRVRDEDGFIVIEPSLDRIFGPGEIVTMSDERDNVHWFVATSEHAYTFDVPVVDLVPGRTYPTPAQAYGMIHLDPEGDATADGHIRARVISFEECIEKFGKT